MQGCGFDESGYTVTTGIFGGKMKGYPVEPGVKCSVCGEPAKYRCPTASSILCGFPLCDKCECPNCKVNRLRYEGEYGTENSVPKTNEWI